MIRYALCCDDGHRFESWFKDSAAFDQQAARGLVSCPTCDSHHVAKAIMAPALVVGRARRPGTAGIAVDGKAGGDGTTGDRPGATAPFDTEPADAPSTEGTPTALLDADRRQLARALRDKVLAETRDVGRAFASEARRLHEADVTSPDRIRGQATLQEARDLIEDGIMVLPLPALPDDLN